MTGRWAGTGFELRLDGAPATSVPFTIAAATGGTAAGGEDHGRAPHLVSILTCAGVTEPDQSPLNITESFRPDSPEIHVLARIANVRQGTRARGTWIAVDTVDAPNCAINSTELTFAEAGIGTAHFQIVRPTAGWPPGNYRLEPEVGGRAKAITHSKRTPAQDGARRSARVRRMQPRN